MGLLVVVLALTASRTNFPLLHWCRSASLRDTAMPSVQKQRHAKKSEGVTPSRRALESRRLAQIQNNQTEPGPRMPGLNFLWENSDAPRTGSRISPTALRLDSTTRPEYLQLHLTASPVSSLPPPA